MQKQAPSIGRILIAVGFTLSCFGLILFLWIAFGGPIPLKPKSYRITAYFPEATQLAVESDVRIGGVSVGKVKAIELAPPDQRVNGKDTTEADDRDRARVRADLRRRAARSCARRRCSARPTSSSPREPSPARRRRRSRSAPPPTSPTPSRTRSSRSPRAARSGVSRTEEATQIDEIFNALDEETRLSFQRWQANAAIAIDGRGLDLNDSFGNLGPFLTDASEIVDVLGRQKEALKGLVRDTGATFEALTARDQELAGVVVGSRQHLRRARLRGRGAGADVPDPADLPARVAADARAPRRVPGQRQAAGPGADPGRPRPLADAALGARALAAPAQPVHRPRRPRAGLGDRAAGAAQVPRRPRAGARQPRPVPRQPQPGDPLPRVPEDERSPTSSSARPRRSRAATSRSPGDPAPRRGLRQLGYLGAETLGDLAQSPADQPRQRLPRARRPQRLQLGQERHLPQLRLQEHRLHARAARRLPRTPTSRRSAPGETSRGSTTATRPAPPARSSPPASSAATSPTPTTSRPRRRAPSATAASPSSSQTRRE